MGPRGKNLANLTPFKRRIYNLANATNSNQKLIYDSQQTLVATTALSSTEKLGQSRSLLDTAYSRAKSNTTSKPFTWNAK